MLLRWALAAGLLAAVGSAWAAGATITVQPRTEMTPLTAYAEVVSARSIKLRATTSGIVTGIDVLPGDRVRAGAVLVRLTGAEIDTLQTRRQAAVTAAKGRLAAARKTLAIERQKRADHLSTRESVDNAEAGLTEAQTQLQTARAELQAVRSAITVEAPAQARVIAVSAAAGDRVAAGDPLLTLQAHGGLWLKATFYGSPAAMVRPGMSGTFAPVDGGDRVAVQVRGIVGRIQPNGGEIVALVTTASAPAWRAGETGRVTLNGAARQVLVVPDRALVLDRGRWWVLVQDGGKGRRQRVVPGPQVAGGTVVEQGLQAGQRVVVADAYLRFHRDFASRYQQPD